MDWITDTVAIGTCSEARDVALLHAHGFRSVLSLDGSLCNDHAAALGLMEVVGVPLLDGAGNELATFKLAVDSLTRLAGAHAPVLVHCQYGRSRAPAVVAGHLMAARGLDPLQAREFVASKRNISISAALLVFLFQL